jgi:hypothetical protein
MDYSRHQSTLLLAMVIMMLGNFLQIALWGTLFFWLGEFTRVLRSGLPLGGQFHLAGLRRHRDEQGRGSCSGHWRRSMAS